MPVSSAIHVVDAIRAALSSQAELTKIWADAQQLLEDDDRVLVWLGECDERALRDLSREFAATYGCEFPLPLFSLLSHFNGIAVKAEESDDEPWCQTIAPRELPEPVLWPARVYGDHFMFCDLDLAGGLDSFAIGGLADSGYLLLGKPDAAEHATLAPAGPAVYWWGLSASEHPQRLASDLGMFFAEFCAAGFCLPLLLRRRQVRGWCG